MAHVHPMPTSRKPKFPISIKAGHQSANGYQSVLCFLSNVGGVHFEKVHMQIFEPDKFIERGSHAAWQKLLYDNYENSESLTLHDPGNDSTMKGALKYPGEAGSKYAIVTDEIKRGMKSDATNKDVRNFGLIEVVWKLDNETHTTLFKLFGKQSKQRRITFLNCFRVKLPSEQGHAKSGKHRKRQRSPKKRLQSHSHEGPGAPAAAGHMHQNGMAPYGYPYPYAPHAAA
eukprot:2544943-Rhodomonas_salina.1